MTTGSEPDDRVEDVLRNWVEREMRPWEESPLDRAAAELRMRDMADGDERICLFRLQDGIVTIDPFIVRHRPQMCDPANGSGDRVALYLSHFQAAVRMFGVKGEVLLAVYVADGYPDRVSGPLFCFQKPAGARGLLVPDVDLLSYDYCLDVDGRFDDPLPFDRKRPNAIFVGSTTGRRLTTIADVEDGTNERVAAAIYFRDKDGVTFDLPNVVQCGTKVRAAVEALGVSGRTRDWAEQQEYRYMLSLDGNGATCARVAIALHSHQLLAKYASANQLYYFHGLQLWRHYVPIVEHADVLALIADADIAIDQHRRIAAEGRRFAQAFLTRLPILRYTALLLGAFAACFGEGAEKMQPPPPLVDCAVGYAGRYPCWGEPNDWNAAGGLPVERITFFPFGFPAEDLSCDAVDLEGNAIPSVAGGEICGAAGKTLAGLRLGLSGMTARDWSIVVRERFADGSERISSALGPLLPGPAALTGFAIAIEAAADAPQPRRSIRSRLFGG